MYVSHSSGPEMMINRGNIEGIGPSSTQTRKFELGLEFIEEHCIAEHYFQIKKTWFGARGIYCITGGSK